MKKVQKSPLALTLGTTLLAMGASMAYAESNPFTMTELNHGYMQVAEGEAAAPMAVPAAEMKKADGTCGAAKADTEMKTPEGKCGDKAMKPAEGKCGAKKANKKNKHSKKMKATEGKCGNKKADAEAM